MTAHYWQVTKTGNNGLSTSSLHETEEQAKFVAGALRRADYAHVTITETNRPVIKSPDYVEEQQKRAERAAARGVF